MESDALDTSGMSPNSDSDTGVLLKIVENVRKDLFEREKGEEMFRKFTFKPLQDGRKVRVAFALGQDLQTVVMVPYVFLVDAQHRQKHVK